MIITSALACTSVAVALLNQNVLTIFSAVRLRGTSVDRDFRGFIIQARTLADNSTVGSFNSGSLHQQVCSNNVCFNYIYVILSIVYVYESICTQVIICTNKATMYAIIVKALNAIN